MAVVSQRMSPRALEPTWFTQRLGWACLSFCQPPRPLRMTGLRFPLLRAWACGRLRRPQPCSVALVLLDGEELAGRVSRGPFVSPQSHSPSAGADLVFGACLSDVEQQQVLHQIHVGEDQRLPHH